MALARDHRSEKVEARGLWIYSVSLLTFNRLQPTHAYFGHTITVASAYNWISKAHTQTHTLTAPTDNINMNISRKHVQNYNSSCAVCFNFFFLSLPSNIFWFAGFRFIIFMNDSNKTNWIFGTHTRTRYRSLWLLWRVCDWKGAESHHMDHAPSQSILNSSHSLHEIDNHKLSFAYIEALKKQIRLFTLFCVIFSVNNAQPQFQLIRQMCEFRLISQMN